MDNPINAPDIPIINSSVAISNVSEDDPIDLPRIIASTKNRNNTEDKLSGTNGDATGILPSFLLQWSDDELYDGMNQLFYWCTYFDNDLRNIRNMMMQKFKNKTGGTFENPILNEKVASSCLLHNFIIEFTQILEVGLQKADGNIDNVSEIKLGDLRPVFNGVYNKFHGLQFLINDTEYTEIQ